MKKAFTMSSSPFTRLIRLTMIWAVLAHTLISASAADDAAAAARASLERIQALRKERPADGVLVFYQAMTHLSLGERDAALDLLLSLKGRKLGLIPVRDAGFDAVWDDPKFQAIRKELVDQEPQTPAAPVAFRLADTKLIPEGIAYDPKGNRFFIGSMPQRKIIVTDAKGQARDFSSASDNLDQVLGLAVDVGRGYLYAVSTNGFHESAKAERRNAVVRYDLKDGRLLDRFLAPEATQLNDLAVAPDGTLYVTDSQTGTLFRKKSDEKSRARTLVRFGETGALRGANGIAVAGRWNIVCNIVDRDRARRYSNRGTHQVTATRYRGDGWHRWPLLARGRFVWRAERHQPRARHSDRAD